MTVKKSYSERVADYVKSRPSYPKAIYDLLSGPIGLSRSAVVADIGSGTGKFSALLLNYGCTVFAVEPDAPMMREAVREFSSQSRFRPIRGFAERTTLPDSSVDAICVAQALHWFNSKSVRNEFQRILRSSGMYIFVWNEQRTKENDLLAELQTLLLRELPDYYSYLAPELNPEVLVRKFLETEARITSFVLDHVQFLDLNGFLSRVYSSSYAPLRTDPSSKRLEEKLRTLYKNYEENGQVRLDYDTIVIWYPSEAGHEV